jgi:hypothetical protein
MCVLLFTLLFNWNANGATCKSSFVLKFSDEFTLPANQHVFHMQQGKRLPLGEAPNENETFCKVEIEQELTSDLRFTKNTTLAPGELSECEISNDPTRKEFLGRLLIRSAQGAKKTLNANVMCVGPSTEMSAKTPFDFKHIQEQFSGSKKASSAAAPNADKQVASQPCRAPCAE